MTEMPLGEQYIQMHEQGYFPGIMALSHGKDIAELVKAHEAEDLLDYGCGKGHQYLNKGLHQEWGGMMPTLYDPYCAAHSMRPHGTFDGVICTDVLEHVPEENILGTLRDLFGYADKFAFLVISTRLAGKCLPDGRNCHLTVQESQWWDARIHEALGSLGKTLDVKVIYEK